jgi:hypothetical protein
MGSVPWMNTSVTVSGQLDVASNAVLGSIFFVTTPVGTGKSTLCGELSF